MWIVSRNMFNKFKSVVLFLKTLSIKVVMTNFEFKKFWTLCIAFSKNSFNFKILKFSKKWKMLFSNDRTFVFDLKIAGKFFFFKCFLWPNLGTLYLALSENSFNFINQKFEKRWNCHFLALKTYVFDLKIAGEQFSQTLLMTTFGLNSVFLALPGNSFDLATQ